MLVICPPNLSRNCVVCTMLHSMYTEIDSISIGCLDDWALWTSWGVGVNNRASLSLVPYFCHMLQFVTYFTVLLTAVKRTQCMSKTFQIWQFTKTFVKNQDSAQLWAIKMGVCARKDKYEVCCWSLFLSTLTQIKKLQNENTWCQIWGMSGCPEESHRRSPSPACTCSCPCWGSRPTPCRPQVLKPHIMFETWTCHWNHQRLKC